jgi:acetyl esterase/lipase
MIMIDVASLVLSAAVGAGEPAFAKKSYTFKTIAGVAIEADVYRPGDAKVRPVVAWLHGGALMVGSRNSVPKQLQGLCKAEGYILVSFDYRLAPEVKLPDIIADVQDGMRWLREQGPKLFHADPQRLVVSGGSAGGYLTMMTGICVTPRPTALVAYWGYGDVDGNWYTKPSKFYRESTPLITEEEALQGLSKKVLTNTDASVPDGKARGRLYRYYRQNGLWTREVTGIDPAAEPRKLDPYCPVRNITSKYPPILMVHGTTDTDVPYELSANMAKELARHKVAHEFVTVEGAGHGLAGGERQAVDDAHQRALAFIRKHLTR